MQYKHHASLFPQISSVSHEAFRSHLKTSHSNCISMPFIKAHNTADAHYRVQEQDRSYLYIVDAIERLTTPGKRNPKV